MRKWMTLTLMICVFHATGAAQPPAGESDTTSGTLARDPQAEALIKALAEQVNMRKAFRFKVVDTFDDVQPNGRKIQQAHVRQGIVRRPDRLMLEVNGDVANRALWKDGKTVTILDRDQNIYARIDDPGTIDQALDTLQNNYGMNLPASDLFYEDPLKSFLDGVVTSEYIGLGLVDETECHHVSFTREDIDWQAWINVGDQPTLRKLVIDYKLLRGEPQYSLKVLSVEELPQADEKDFQFTPPAGAEKVDAQPKAKPSADQPAAQ